MEPIKDRLIRYLKINTRANPDSTTTPSNSNIVTFGQLLKSELDSISCVTQIEEATNNGGYFICAKILSNQTVKKIPTIGFVAHMDTAYNYTGNPQPIIVQGIDTLRNKYDIDIRSKTFSEQEFDKWLSEGVLANAAMYSILGVKNKAGIAEIMALCEYIDEHPSIPHGQINILFTSDAELGRSMDHIEDQGTEVQVTDGNNNPIWIDPNTGNTTTVYTPDIGLEPVMRLNGGFMDCTFAYEVCAEGEDHVEYNNYNLSYMTITFKGSKTPGLYGDDAIVNAAKNAALFVNALTVEDKALTLDNGSGIAFVKSISGDYTSTDVELQIKDLDTSSMQDRIRRVLKVLQSQSFYDEYMISYKVVEVYSNIKNNIPDSVKDLAIKANYDKYLRGVVSPIINHGYACSELTKKGIPMISISAGGYNAYTPHECIPIPSLDNCLEVLVNIILNSWDMDFSNDYPEYDNSGV